MDKQILKQILRDNQQEVERYVVEPRGLSFDGFPCRVLVGVRRAGKSYMLYHVIQQFLTQGHKWDEMLYLNFEDERLENFGPDDFNRLLECHQEMYGKRPMLFLDEIQNIEGWQKFARNLADKKYSVFITGSNAKMLSKEIMAELGGRYLPVEVYPFSFAEYLSFIQVPFDTLALTATESRARFMKAYNDYFVWGGLPESIPLPVKRHYLSSVFQKIYLGDIAQRNGISNPRLLQLMVKKMAESVKQPVSYNRIAKILSSISGKISVPTVASYISYSEDAWLLLRLRNIASAFAEKESVCKYYFIDNGILSLQLMDGETALLENLVALSLFRKYGHDLDNDRVYFYHANVEVDFYVPEDELAVQVAYSLADPETAEREVGAITKLTHLYPCRRRIIVTYDEEGTLTDQYGNIEVIPCWKWLLKDIN